MICLIQTKCCYLKWNKTGIDEAVREGVH
jgi:hypothetical protein